MKEQKLLELLRESILMLLKTDPQIKNEEIQTFLERCEDHIPEINHNLNFNYTVNLN